MSSSVEESPSEENFHHDNQEAVTINPEEQSCNFVVEDARDEKEFILDPSRSKSEKHRDALLKLLDSMFFQYLGLFVLLLVIVDGAFFFFLLVGWQSMCDDSSKTDCDPRNWWYNISVQVLNALFTYTATVSMPWRCINAIHLSGGACPKRSFEIGHDLYGRPTEQIWFHIPRLHKALITAQLLGNCTAQFANQGTRIYYPDFDSQNEPHGSTWVNVFFVISFLLAFTAACCIFHQEGKLRKAFPGRWGPGPADAIKAFICKKGDNTAQEVAQGESKVFDGNGAKDRNNFTDLPKDGNNISCHLSSRPSVSPFERESMRCFGM